MSSGEHCDFKDMLDLMICNRLVCGINDAHIQRKLLQEETLLYADAFKTALAVEVTAKDIQDLTKQGQYTLRSLDVKQCLLLSVTVRQKPLCYQV